MKSKISTNMALDIIGYTKDFRTDTNVLYAQITIDDYLELIGGNFQDFEIQRRREKSNKAYKRMEKDIKEGAVLPSITLAVKPDFVNKHLIDLVEAREHHSIVEQLRKGNKIFILDGLQRSFILNDLKISGISFKPQQKLLLEIWFEDRIERLIYRFVILNAGQKPMSFRHKLDILFYGLKERLERDFVGLELLTERNAEIRTQAKQFLMRNVATSYHCFLIKNYSPAKDNIVVQQMQEDKIAFNDLENVNEEYKKFTHYLGYYVALDDKIFNTYSSKEDKHFLNSENVMNAFFAAIAVYIDADNPDERTQRIKIALEKLINFSETFDFFGLEKYKEIKEGVLASKKNLGLVYKRVLFDGFREFFRSEGEKGLAKCWEMAYNEL